ncbi:MAG: diacylglycerol kinase family lipid kinase [Oscillospiraceae bacterium]|jgi:YegS/Rv2252/BmrU family lipid kinase|nr:diacylglycerol kinase family lipid kinase [Oscillospiraceae bacterium]
MQKKLLLIINPHSGRGLSNTKIGDIVMKLSQGDFVVTVMFTQVYTVSQLARENAAGYDLVVCCGGDGTLSDIIAGLVELPNPPPIGYIPTGTANDVATTLALSRNTDTAVRTILDGNTTRYDVGVFGGESFSYIAAFGVFTAVSYATPQAKKKALGHLAYVFGGISEVPTMAQTHHTIVEYDDGVLEGDFSFGGVTNSTSVAGFVRINPEYVDLGDGLFEVILIKTPMNIMQFADIIRDVTSKNFASDSVVLLHTKRVRFTFDEPVAWTRDGESGGEHKSVEISIHPRAVRIITPRVDTDTTP